MSRLLAKRRRIAVDNIRQALPFMKRHSAWTCTLETPEEISRDAFIHLGISLVEVCRLYHGKGDTIIENVEIRGREHYERARARHTGVIFGGGHCGNWELMALCFKRHLDSTISVIARRQNNPYLNTMVEKMRMHYGNSVIYKQGALRAMIAILKKDGVIGLLADQVVSVDEGVLIEVMGRTAWASKMPIIMAQKTGAALVPTFIHREGNRHILTLFPEFELSTDTSEAGIRANVQALSRYLEDFVCAHPADWYWVHRRWKRAGELVQ
jgi:Kdo2-lipid IVA lauroyltransferase/acyltransferase